MLRFTRRAEYGLMALAYMVWHRDENCSVRELADTLTLPRRLLAEILKDLGRESIVTATRGPGGGYRLSVDPEKTSVASIVTAIEGPIVVSECAGGAGCEMENQCLIRGGVIQVADRIRGALDELSLAQIASPEAAQV